VVGDHCYAVRGVDAAGRVTLYNPWGHDAESAAFVRGADDGVITLSWAEFCRYFERVYRI
jgi:hypothetical protein